MALKFVQIADSHRQVQIINTRQIVRVFKNGVVWNVILTAGSTLELNDAEAKTLIGQLPGAEPKTAGKAF